MKIGKRAKAKKYKALREKQAQANALIKSARKRLGTKHAEVKKLTSKKKNFFNKRGIATPTQLSFKNLSTKDIKAYENYLDSVLTDFENNTFLNEEKHKQFKEKMRENFKQQWGDSGLEIDDLLDVVNSDIVEQLKAVGIPYKNVLDEVTKNYPDTNTQDIKDALTSFWNDRNKSDAGVVLDDFLQYVDDFMDIRTSYGFLNIPPDIASEKELFNLYRDIPTNERDIDSFNDAFMSYMYDEDYTGDFRDYFFEYKSKWG